MTTTPRRGQRVLLTVTDPMSVRLLDGLPAALDDRGWEVHLVVGRNPGEVPGAINWVVPMRRDPSPFADLRSLLRWIGVVRNVRPQVVLAGTPKAALLGLLAAWICRVPIRIYHLRGLRLETSHGLQARILAVLERLAMAVSTSVLAVSPSLRDECVERRLVRRAKVDVLGAGSSNGVDLARFAPAPDIARAASRSEAGLGPDVVVVGYVGRVTPSKGLDDLVTAAILCADRSTPFAVLLVGSEEVPGYAGQVLERMRVRGLMAVHMAWADDMAAVYPAMDLLCLPSLREGFPNVVLEASASGLPVLTTDATGCRDAVRHGETGWVARAGDPADLARCLEQGLDDERERRRRGAAGRAFVEVNFARPQVQAAVAEYLSAAARNEGVEMVDKEIPA